jgi:ABC-type glycerol-3-phosphate transport system permease component
MFGKNKQEDKIHHYKMHRRHPNRSVGGDVAIDIFLVLLGFLFVIPIVFSIVSSLKPLSELFQFPPTLLYARNPTFDNFSDLFVTLSQQWVPFSRYLFNTVFLTVVGTIGHVFIASMAAYVLAKYDFPGGKFFFDLVVTTLMFSGYVTGIPSYIIQCRLHMIDTYWALLIPAFAAPIGMYLMKQFMTNIPDSLIEAAKIDGASEWTIFMNLVMPNVKPAWLTMVIFAVQSLWNNAASNVIYTETKKTLVYALNQVALGGIARTGQAAAVSVVVMSVPILVFVLSQSQIMETMATSGLKD